MKDLINYVSLNDSKLSFNDFCNILRKNNIEVNFNVRVKKWLIYCKIKENYDIINIISDELSVELPSDLKKIILLLI